jgi:hypothetical protein
MGTDDLPNHSALQAYLHPAYAFILFIRNGLRTASQHFLEPPNILANFIEHD